MAQKLTDTQLHWLTDKCNDFDLKLRTDYDGRGRNGSECVGIVCQSHELGTAALLMTAALNRASSDMDWDDVLEELETAPAPDLDSMGLDSIAYWPGITA